MNDVSAQVFTDQFISDVQKCLSPQQRSTFEHFRIPQTSRVGISLKDFLLRLFARAPHEFLVSRSTSQVASIVAGCLETIETMASSSDRVAVSVKHAGGNLSLFTALDDCPFIVSSIAERLSDAQVRVNAFLHPIFVYKGTTVAVSYVDIDPACQDAVTTLLPRLNETVEVLKCVVEDFEPMSSFITRWAESLDMPQLATEFGAIETREASDLLSWLVDGSFFLLGTALFEKREKPVPEEALGLWRVPGTYREEILQEVHDDLGALEHTNLDLSIRKLRHSSAVHRPATLIHLLVRTSRNSNEVLSLCGYLTSKAWTKEAQDIPFVRRKVTRILEEDAALPGSHDYKYMVEVVDNMPTDDALCASLAELRAYINLALGVFSREVTRSHTSIDELRRRAFTMVVLPPERYSARARSEIQKRIELALGAVSHSSEVHLDSSKRRQLRLYISTPLPENHDGLVPSDTLAQAITQATLTWEHQLEELIIEAGLTLPFPSLRVFPEDYQVATDTFEALTDLKILAHISAENPTGVSLYAPPSNQGSAVVSIFSLTPDLSISSAIPILENVGLEVRSANSYSCRIPQGTVYLLKLATRAYDGEVLEQSAFNASVSPGLTAVMRGEAHNDVLNLLLRKASLSIRQISLLRAYCALLWQVNKFTTKRSMWEALAFAPPVAAAVCRIFDVKFNPESGLSLDERKAAIIREEEMLTEALRKVPDISHDRVLKAIVSLLRSTVRTNFYSRSDTIAFKLRSGEVELMPHPRPLFEIFVFSPRIEGTHLRSARVARGGIRWSERLDDYRSEVLGLMKTQKVKNVIIVPSGAKGGFVMKTPIKEGDSLAAAVESSYREYISALLTLADNNVHGAVTHPAKTVVYDDPDPYFVVAADKGTATFSDVANSIAQNEFQFWLGDAFASGGSAGYDHKKYGITAKGGWECVCRHFRDLGIDYENHPFSVVGIGDMSGDVFGNGLLSSRKMVLIGAFNHKHVFVDPSPDPELSFEERTRLFNLPRSQWSDYTTSLISKGGGVFNRLDKEIQLTPEMRSALSVPEDVPDTVDGETLVTLVLGAKVDLLWNGGIGTYVKAKTESHSDVNDGSNDRVRINAEQLRARVIGEGGNLGFTQKARVEFSLRGGRINTDAIDNSGGVDLSDHEVNLKLLLAPLVQAGTLTLSERNTLLREVDAEVVAAVLRHNKDQALMLSISQLRSKTTTEQYRLLIRLMNRLGYLDRQRDNLPDESELDQRAENKLGLCRPELALCSAAVKMWIKDELRSSALCADDNLVPFLLNYFPEKVQREFRESVLAHPLKADIVASEVVNSLLPAVGISYVNSIVSMRGVPASTVMKCLLAADRILNTDLLREKIRRLDTTDGCADFTQLWLEIGVALREASQWLLHYHGSSLSLGEMVKLYSDAFDTLAQHAVRVFSGEELVRFERRVGQYRQRGASHEEAVLLSLYRRVLPVLEILWAAREFRQDVQTVASVFSQVFDDLGVNNLFKFESMIEVTNKWEQELVNGSYQEIRRNISLITGQLLAKSVTTMEDVRKALHESEGFEAIRSTMHDVNETARQRKPFQIAVLPVVSRQLRLLKV
jgi:glutamate dehydrogenase